VFLLSPIHLTLSLRSPRVVTIACAGLLAIAGGATYLLTRRKPTAEEIERERREQLARSGRITDGTIMDTMVAQTHTQDPDPSQSDPSQSDTSQSDTSQSDTSQSDTSQSDQTDPSHASTPANITANTPEIIIYNYRIAGVTYECAQDVSTLAEYVHDIRTDLPIQVRYAPQNPGNSIVVAESWSGLRLKSSHPHQHAD
jgi:hypothetical protein